MENRNKIKICITCKKEKELSEFHKNSRNPDGLHKKCKLCRCSYNIKDYHKHKESHKNKRTNYYINNKESLNSYRSLYKKEHPDKELNWRKIRYLRHKNEICQKLKNKYSTNINYKLKSILRHRIWLSLNNNIKSKRTKELIGCTLEELKNHLQQTAIKNGYKEFNIENFNGKEYHVDHIIPCSVFKLDCSYHQKLCFHYSNLQILSAKENLSKGNSYD